MNSFWSSSIHWFINRNYAHSEFVKLEERMSESGMLRIEVLVVGVCRPFVFLTIVGRCSGGGQGISLLVYCGVRGRPFEGGASCGGEKGVVLSLQGLTGRLRVSIDEVVDRKYDTLSNLHGPQPELSRLSR
ncbi:hypothetical protein BHE74_00050565 [Ensete ventricosum]|nr:hypothetical protein BHE74_00050565 [Ensete ventricosum]